MIEFLNHWDEQWGRYALLLTAQNTVFLLLTLGVINRLKQVKAQWRYMVGMAALFKCMLPLFFYWPVLRVPSSPMMALPAALPLSEGALPANEAAASLSPAGALMALWAILALLLILAPVFRTLMMQRRLKGMVIDSIVLKGRTIQVISTPRTVSPVTLGLRSRAIYVPADWVQWPAECQAISLAHELAHIKRHDGAARWLQIAVQALYFFHPLIWILNKQIDALREMACDDSAVASASGCSSISYSKALVQIAENMTSPQWECASASALIKRRNELFKRIHYQLEANMTHKKSRLRAAAVILTLSAMALSWAGTRTVMVPGHQFQNPKTSSINSRSASSTVTSSNTGPKPVLYYTHNVVSDSRTRKQDTGKLIGKVIDKDTGKGLFGVNILFPDFERRGAATNPDGEYVIELPVGKDITLQAIYMGYKQVKITGIVITKGVTTTMDVEMEVENKTGDAVVIDGSGQATTPPPPPTEKDFVAYDTPPLPVGGWTAVTKEVVYPQEALKNKIEGTVLVYAQIDEQGRVLKTRVRKGPEELHEAASNAVIRTNWKPAQKDKKPVSCWVGVPVIFKATKEPAE